MTEETRVKIIETLQAAYPEAKPALRYRSAYELLVAVILSAQCTDVRVNLGRNKIVNFTGLLSGIYPALFTVRPNDKSFLGKTSYSYAEVLCGSVLIRPAKKSK